MKGIQDILTFSNLLNKFRELERVQTVPNSNRRENDVEHSYQLSMLAWYIVDANKLSLNKDLIIKYALIHDFVEIYAGDTYAYTEINEKHKIQKEYESYLRLKKEFSDFFELHSLIEKYEKREDKESRFVHALDKIQAEINIYLDGGKTWKKLDINLQMIIDRNQGNKMDSPEMEVYINEFVKLLQNEEGRLFN